MAANGRLSLARLSRASALALAAALAPGTPRAIGAEPSADSEPRPAGPEAGAARAPRALVLARAGELSREEVSPGSRGRASNSWKFVLSGTGFADVRFPPGPAPEGIEALRAALLTEELASKLALRGVRVAAAEAADPRALAELIAALDGARPSEIGRVEALFGKPPPPAEAETRALAELRRALLGAGGKAEGEVLRPAPDFEAFAAAEIGLLCVRAAGASDDEVAARDRLLGRVVEKAGAERWVVVVNWPLSGAGSIFVRGPSAAQGRVVARERSARLLTAFLARLFGVDPAELPDELRKEDLGALFR